MSETLPNSNEKLLRMIKEYEEIKDRFLFDTQAYFEMSSLLSSELRDKSRFSVSEKDLMENIDRRVELINQGISKVKSIFRMVTGYGDDDDDDDEPSQRSQSSSEEEEEEEYQENSSGSLEPWQEKLIEIIKAQTEDLKKRQSQEYLVGDVVLFRREGGDNERLYIGIIKRASARPGSFDIAEYGTLDVVPSVPVENIVRMTYNPRKEVLAKKNRSKAPEGTVVLHRNDRVWCLYPGEREFVVGKLTGSDSEGLLNIVTDDGKQKVRKELCLKI